MYIERDREYNLLYISFRDSLPEGIVASTKELVPGAYYDLDSDGKLLGIEIVNTEYVLGFPVTELHLSGELLGVKEAAELAGKDRANFLRDLASRPDFPAPVARVASGQLWLSKDVERYLREQAKGPTSSVVAWVEDETDKASDQEHSGEERQRDYVYEDLDQYEDHEVTDVVEKSTEGSVDLDTVDHEQIYLLGRDLPEERKSA
jgi:uncharacterized protein YuzE